MKERGEKSQDPLQSPPGGRDCFPDRRFISKENLSRNFPLEYRTLRAPFSVQVEITEKCNNLCVHCYNSYRHPSRSHSSLSPEKTESVVNQLSQAGVFGITFTGGEPLLAMESLLAGIWGTTRQDLWASLNSNLTVGTTDCFRELKKAGLSGVLTSLMSCDEVTHDKLTQRKGSFRAVMAGIDNARLAGLKVAVNMVVSKDNLADVYRTGEFCRRLGIGVFCATRVGPSSYNLEWFDLNGLGRPEIQSMLDQLLKLKEEKGVKVDTLEPLPYCGLGDLKRYEIFVRKRCLAGVAACIVGAEGNVRPCPHSEVVYGNIFNEEFQTIWLKMKNWRMGVFVPRECGKCGSLVKCGGGCRVAGSFSQGKKGLLDQPDIYALGEENISCGLTNRENKPALADSFHFMKLVFDKTVRFRKEDFGGSLAGRSLAPIMVNKPSFALLESIGKEIFTLEEIRAKFGYSVDRLEEFMGYLFAKGIVRPAEDEE